MININFEDVFTARVRFEQKISGRIKLDSGQNP